MTVLIITRSTSFKYDTLEEALEHFAEIKLEEEEPDETLNVSVVENGVLKDHFAREPKDQT